MKLWLERNTGDNSEEVPHFANIEIITLTIDSGAIFKVPVHAKYLGQKKTFFADVCGFRLEDVQVNVLLGKIQRLLEGLVNMTRLPTYVFIARRAKGIYPVYTINDEVLATTPGGPVFRHVELSKVREYLSDYLHDIKILGKEGLSDKLHVRGVNMHTLGLRRPIMYLKKRVPDEIDFWAPVFVSGDGKRIYAYVASSRREVPIEDGREVVLLRELVAQVLQTDKRLNDLYDVRPDRLMPDYWERFKETLKPVGQVEVQHIELPLYKNGTVWVGVEAREEEDRYSLFLGKDADDVQQHAAVDFKRRGLVN